MENLSPFKKERHIHHKLLSFIKNNPKGMTTTDIMKATKISRKTLEKHLQLLNSENEIYMKQFGPTRVYYPNHRVHHLDFEKLQLKNKTIWFDILENEFGRYLLIQEKRKQGNEWITKGSVLIPLDSGKQFVNALKKILNSDRIKKEMLKN